MNCLAPSMPPGLQVAAVLPAPEQQLERAAAQGRLWANVFSCMMEAGRYEASLMLRRCGGFAVRLKLCRTLQFDVPPLRADWLLPAPPDCGCLSTVYLQHSQPLHRMPAWQCCPLAVCALPVNSSVTHPPIVTGRVRGSAVYRGGRRASGLPALPDCGAVRRRGRRGAAVPPAPVPQSAGKGSRACSGMLEC